MESELSARGYELCEPLGRGGTAWVYRVKKVDSGAEYACKVSENLTWLRVESELLSTLHHPLFPKWKDYWDVEGKGCMIMEYIEGSNLESHLRRRGVFSQREVIRIVLELADGLGYLHDRNPGIIYRDLKPENIILQQDGRARLLDLGAAAVPDGWRVGTPGYAAPEQQLFTDVWQKEISDYAAFGQLQPACDVYGLGMVMHYMLTGRNPLLTQEDIKPVRKYVSGIWLGIDDIVWRCVNMHPQERIPGMRELVRELSAYYNQGRLQIIRQEVKVLLGKRRRQKTVYEKNVWMSEYKKQ